MHRDDPARLIKLVDRPSSAVLFRSGSGPVDTIGFLRDAYACASALPQGEHVVLCCQDRYRFAVGFAACLLRRQVALLTPDSSPRTLHALSLRHGGLHALTDTPAPVPGVPSSAVRLADDTCASDRGQIIAPPRIPAGQPACIVFTSGSTGEPVGTLKTFGELAARSVAAGQRFGFTEKAPVTTIGTVPPNHMYGVETTILLPLHAPAASWCDPVFYAADLDAALCKVPGRRVLITTPLQMRVMLQMASVPQPLSLVISATAPLDAELAAAVEHRWGAPVMEIFGASEVGSIASRRTTDGPGWMVYPGLVLAGEEAPLVTAPEAPARHFNDVVTLDASGRHFTLVGRCGDMVKLGGRRASLAGLTRLLNQVDGVEDGVFMAPDDLESRPTARLVALVVAPARSNDDLLDALRRQIDPVFLPRPLVRVDALPRNALGKIPRDALLALVNQPRAQPVAWNG